jgi:hypothetical protein
MGLTPPADLHHPISVDRHLEGDRIVQPLRLLDPAIDGVVTDFFEWRGAGSIDTQPPLGAMWRTDRLFTAIRFGWNREQLFLRLDPDDGMQARTSGVVVAITLQTAERTFRLAFSPAPSEPARFMLSEAIGAEAWRDIGPYHSMSRKKIFELAVPWKDLRADPSRQIRLSIVVSEHGLEIARYPHHQPAVLTVPGPEFEAGLWRV